MTRNHSNNRICQVDIADTYDHKHQDLSPHDERRACHGCRSISVRLFFSKPSVDGIVFSQETFRTIKATYYRLSRLILWIIYKSDAAINGLDLDLHREEKAVELFALNLMKAGTISLKTRPNDRLFRSWNRVNSALPGLVGRAVG